MEKVGLLSIHIIRIVSVSLLSCSLVNFKGMILVPHRPLPILHSKRRYKSLSETVDEVILNFCSKLNIIIAENEILIVGGKESIVIHFSCKSKVEWIQSIRKSKSCILKWEGKVSIGVLRKAITLWHLKSVSILTIIDLDGEIREG